MSNALPWPTSAFQTACRRATSGCCRARTRWSVDARLVVLVAFAEVDEVPVGAADGALEVALGVGAFGPGLLGEFVVGAHGVHARDAVPSEVGGGGAASGGPALSVDDGEDGGGRPLDGDLVAPRPMTAWMASRVSLSIPFRRLNWRGSRTTSRVAGVVDPGGGEHLQRIEGGSAWTKSLVLKGPVTESRSAALASSSSRSSSVTLVRAALHEHVQGAAGRHEQPRRLAALAGEVLDAGQAAALDVDELGEDGVGLADGVVRVRDEHRGLELGLGRALPAAGAGADDGAQEQARRRALGGARVERTDDPVGPCAVELARPRP